MIVAKMLQYAVYCTIVLWEIASSHDLPYGVGVLGGMATISCPHSLTGKKLSSLKWNQMVNDEPIQIYYYEGGRQSTEKYLLQDYKNYYSNITDGLSYLYIPNLTKEDEGIYKCIVEIGIYKKYEVPLTVIVPPEKIDFFYEFDGISHLIENNVFNDTSEYATVKITCQVTGGDPSPSVKWFLGGKLLDHITELNTSNQWSNTLTYGPLMRIHQGETLVCQASNTNYTAPLSASIILDINLPPLSVRITRRSSGLAANGSSYDIECRSNGANPRPIMTWWLDSKILYNYTQIEIDNGETSMSTLTSLSTLTFEPLAENDGMLLECRAENPHMNLDPLIDRWQLNVYYPPTVKATSNPFYDVKEGNDVMMLCKATANPNATDHKWFFNNLPINMSRERYSGGGEVLKLSEVTKEMAGRYSCQAFNTIGKGAGALQLQIRYAPVCSTNKIQVIGGGHSEEISVLCKVDAFPIATGFEWRQGTSRRMTGFAEDRFNTEEENTSVLKYKLNERNNLGLVHCLAKNDVGKQKDPCYFDIKYATAPFKPRNCAHDSNDTDYVKIECTPGNDGGLNQTFVSETINAKTKRLTRNITSDIPLFYLDNLSAGTEYLVMIYAFNALGKSEVQSVTLKTLPGQKVNEKVANYPYEFPITAILGILIGVVGALVFVAVVVGVIMRLKSTPDRKTDEGRKPLKQAAEDDMPKTDGGDAEEGPGTTIPSRLKHANINMYSSPDETKSPTEATSEASAADNDGVEYAELNFANGKKTKKKKAKKSKKQPNGTNKKEDYDPTVYASIDHIQMEKNKLTEEVKNKEDPPVDSRRSSIPTSNGPPLTVLPHPSDPPNIVNSLPPVQLVQPSVYTTPKPDTATPAIIADNQNPISLEETPLVHPRKEKQPKSTMKPTNLDKPTVPRKPLFSQDVLKRRRPPVKKTVETQTSDCEDPYEETIISPEGIPLIDTVESFL